MPKLPSSGLPPGKAAQTSSPASSPEEIRLAEAVVAKCAGGACVIRSDGTLLAANPKGKSIKPLLQGTDAPEFLALVKNAAASESIMASAYNISGEEGVSVLEITVVPQPGQDDLVVLVRDQTAEQNLRSALVESRQRYKDLVEVSSDFAWEVGADKTFVFVSPRGALGHSAAQLVGRPPGDFVLEPETYDPLPFITEHPIENMEIWMQRADKSAACMIVSCLPLIDGNEQWHGARGVCRDITEERERETALAHARNREQILNYIVSSIRDEVDPNNMLSVAAESAARSVGATGCNIYRMGKDKKLEIAAAFGNSDEVRGLDTVLNRLDESGAPVETEDGEWQFLLAATRYRQPINGAICMWKNSTYGRWTNEDAVLIADVANQVGIAHEQVTNHEWMLKLSRTDGLTGLLNRRAFYEEELPRHLKRLEFDLNTAALFYIDLDNFKLVNDTFGHHLGDEAIIKVRDILLKHTRPSDAVVRQGGDEFAIWFNQVDEKVAEMRARELIEASKELDQFSGNIDRPLGFSIGIAMYDPALTESLDDLMLRADAAMYQVKKSGKGGYAFARPAATGETEKGE